MTNSELLSSYLDALRPIVYISNFDFSAVDDLIARAVSGDAIEEYNNAQGAVRFDTKVPCVSADSLLFQGEDSAGGSVARLSRFLDRFITDASIRKVLVLKDVHTEISDPEIIAQLKSIALRTMQVEDYWVPVIVVSTKMSIPVELEKLVTVFEIAYPTKTEIASLLDDYAKTYAFGLTTEDRDELALAFRGLSEFEIRQILNLAYQRSGSVSRSDMELILKEKEQSIKKSGLLEAVPVSQSQMDIGGLENLVGYLQQKSAIYKNLAESIKFGVDIPKGILIVGMPGCGKSLTAKACAQLFKAPLLRLDVGRLLGKYVGESESNLRRAISLAEAATPCVLWIDEIEKAFAGVGKDSSGGGVATRLFGYFLTWMQEKDSTVYVVATANDITGIPPEFLRRGRFDEIFSVKLPNDEERKRIFEIHLKRRNKDPRQLGIKLNELVSKTNGQGTPCFSGADIESIVKTAIEAAFSRRQELRMNGDEKWTSTDLTQEDLESAIKNTIPIRKTLSDKIELLEKSLAKFQITSASEGSWKVKPQSKQNRVQPAPAGSGSKKDKSEHCCATCTYWRGRQYVTMAQVFGGLGGFQGSSFQCEKDESWHCGKSSCCNYMPIGEDE